MLSDSENLRVIHEPHVVGLSAPPSDKLPTPRDFNHGDCPEDQHYFIVRVFTVFSIVNNNSKACRETHFGTVASIQSFNLHVKRQILG